MKKTLVIIFSLILIVMAMPTAAIAAPDVTYEVVDQFDVKTEVIDPFTGNVLAETNDEGEVTKVEIVQLGSDRAYRLVDQTFIFYSGQQSEKTVFSDVYDMEYTTNPVNVSTNGTFNITIYKDGEVYDETTSATLSEPGGYMVYITETDAKVFSFIIIPPETGEYSSLEFPSMYIITNVKLDGVNISTPTLREADLSREGVYEISYLNNLDKSAKTMSLLVDHTPPVLEIYGLENGVAKNAVTFGELEKGSTIVITYEGREIQPQESYKDTGNYVVEYRDSAGNVSYYEFQIDVFLDVSTWLVIAIGIGAIIAAIVFIVYNRNHLRVS